jgi:hypothetical protein
LVAVNVGLKIIPVDRCIATGKTRLIAVSYKGQGRKCRKEKESHQDHEPHGTQTGPST